MSQILLLNASFRPLAVITRLRALSLVARDRVEAASEDAVPIRGVSRTVFVPAVLRLCRYINVPRRNARWSRRGVLERDRYTCAYYGAEPGMNVNGQRLSKRTFTIDHIIPLSKGGKNTWSNTICACWACNQHKRDRTPHEAHMRLLWEPKTPRVDYLVFSGNVPQAWKVYLEV